MPEVRIIGGQWKRSKLVVADKPGLRPTPNRVRETLFNWLGQNLSGWRVLDAFAGSGALGFEAASRGASYVTLLERDAELLQNLQAAALRLKAQNLRVERAEALNYMAHLPAQSYELVLLDPPFDANLFEPALAAATRVLTAHGMIYLESNVALTSPPDGFEVWRQARAGAVHFQLLRRIS